MISAAAAWLASFHCWFGSKRTTVLLAGCVVGEDFDVDVTLRCSRMSMWQEEVDGGG